MALFKVTVNLPFQGSSLPRDVAQHTWWFDGHGNPTIDVLTEVGEALAEFYNNNDGGNSISNLHSTAVNRSEVTLRFAVIDVTTGLQIGDATEVPFDFNDPDLGESPMPNEVALCTTFFSTVDAGSTPIRRRRGRVYLGPWLASQNVISDDGGFHGSPHDDLVDLVATRSEELLGLVGTFADWVVYSRVAESVFNVNGGWVDNEWDTQRRRGTEANNRVTWNV